MMINKTIRLISCAAVALGVAGMAFCAELRHRWSFNGDWSDSVGGADAVGCGTYVSLYGRRVHMGYGSCTHGTGYVNLGTNMLDTAAATIEIWARHDGVQKWSRIFDYGADDTHYFQMPWTNGTNLDKDSISAKNGGGETQAVDTMAPYEIGTDYYIAVSFERQGDATLVRWQRRDAVTGELQKSGTLTMPDGMHTFVDPVLYLGHSQYSADKDALAAYDEVRIWSGVLTDEQLAASAAAGPDATIAVDTGVPQFAAAATPEPPTQRAEMPGGGFRLMTYNVQYCYDEVSTIIPDRTAARIIAENPDFCCVNEVHDSEVHPEATLLAKLTGMHKSFGGNESGSNGNLILSKEEPLGAETVFLKMSSAGWGDRYCLICEFTNFCVAVTHLDTARESSGTAEVHASNAVAIATIRDAFAKYTKPVFLCGDWNTRPNWENMDRFNEFLDILSPTNGVRTYQEHGKSSLILDYISVDKAHREDIYVQNTYVVEDLVTSDHNPVMAELYRRPAASELGWIDESFLTTGRTGTWSKKMLWDDETWRTTLAGTCTFTPNAPSHFGTVTVDVTAEFDPMPDGDINTPEEDIHAAVSISPKGSFVVWTLGNVASPLWLEVAAAGVTPETGVEYALRFTIDYAAQTYSVAVQDGGEWKSLAAEDGTASFKLAASGNKTSAIVFQGSGALASIFGGYVEVEGFAPNETIFVKDSAEVILSAAQAAWLNGLGDRATVAGKAAAVSANDLNDAYLLNLDITQDGFGYEFTLTSIDVDPTHNKVVIGVSLVRQGKVEQAINGRLVVYGADSVAKFTDDSLEPLATAELSDNDFSEGDTATAEIPLTGGTPPTFFKARIRER